MSATSADSNPSTTASASAVPAAAPAGRENVVPSEVGWQFVPQYYTFVNKQPNRLHCFYTRTSTFIHGTEGEEGKPCYGQQEIHNRITQIGFQDCKVFIHSVDAQSSANGGIIIQVIGEMSNRGEPWRKFVQTFFLAEQPNGYFVLNDIFRFLKEEAVESDEATSEAEPTESAPAAAPSLASAAAATAASAYSESIAPAVPTVAPPEPVREPTPPPPREPTPPAPEPVHHEPSPAPESSAPASDTGAESHVNGVEDTTEEDEPEPASPVAEEETPEPEPEPEAAPTPAEPEQPPAPAAPTPQQQPTPSATPAPAAAPQPAAPPAPKTWANLAAANSKKWGSNVAQEIKGVSEAPPPAPATPRSSGPPAAQAARPTGPPQGGNVNPALAGITTPQCFVKGVIEIVPQAGLEKYLTQRFGPVKELEIVRSKACAFLEFTTLDAAKRAIIASLPMSQGGEGGIWVPTDQPSVKGDHTTRISIETKKERADRPPPRPHSQARGGLNGDARGSFRGRGMPRGRGAAPPPAAK